MSKGFQGKLPQPRAENTDRMYYLDNLRTFVIVMVVVMHTSIGYMAKPPEWWYVIDIKNNMLFDLLVMVVDVFIMPIMFLIAGYFALPVLIKKGTAEFWRSKFSRIVVPWVIGVLLFAPLITYVIPFSRMDIPPSYMSFWANFFQPPFFNQAHYWFLGVLAWFFALLTVVYHFSPSFCQRKTSPSSPSIGTFLFICLVPAIAFFVANLYFHSDEWVSVAYIAHIQPTRIGLYLCYFGLGVHAWRNLWFTKAGYNPEFGRWFFAFVVMLAIFTAYRIVFSDTTPLLLKAGHALVHSIFNLAATFGFMVLFRDFFNSDAYLWRRLSANSYTIYYINYFILLPIACLVQKLEAPVWIKFVSVSTLAVVLCYLVSEYIIGRVISISRKKPAQILDHSS
ncbi:acyltransferase family protein [Propionispora hippei]|uniref:Peptidoglycan/LPS O-acetylase OafA/YrhL, contains acyltransferase and SGNH-hydrolase domains n=1 Tax=Propionispora hippei DSM 15287 TaxID=1123003 RepID=A0A1M6P8F3_9FIRM|nr:acyltransferase family protein [Propionispora hippei]SHK04205.1 Peptidoglycan/LPS O-acetylase OafA/YrhL, contains acyltransferase and SGNH-hydrolase domains [Propionispora hippei DSM 15287]